ncbi:MAG: rhodanese-like domain-containing protein [Myxococcota bacterium]
MREVKQAELRARRDAGEPVVVVDVRGAEDFAAGHVEGAIHLPLAEIEADPRRLPLGRPIVTVCGKGGGRSTEAAAALAAAGATDVGWLEGGTLGWSAEGTDPPRRRVVLLYDRDCPNVELARANLRRALEEARAPACCEEVDLGAPDTPVPWTRFGSPTVLVDGRDVAGASADDGPTCRTYLQAGVRSNAPPVDILVAALRAAGLGSPA